MIFILLFTNCRLGSSEFYVLPQIFYSEQYTFFGHRPGGTWHGQDVAVILWLVDRPWVLLLLGSILLFAPVVATRRRNIYYILSQFPRLLFTRASKASPPLPLFHF
jgi:hypothetical protein